VQILSFRSLALWILGYPSAALTDTHHALKEAGDIGQTATLMAALGFSSITHVCCRNYAEADAESDKLGALANQKGSAPYKAISMLHHGLVLALTGEVSEAVKVITSGLAANRSAGATVWMPINLSYLATAYAGLGKFDDASRSIGEAMAAVETTKEKWCEAEVNRTAGEIALMSPESDAAKAEAYLERALSVARAQQAKSWELRSAMSMARLWRDQGKREEARELLAPVYGWFTEGFDTLDLKEAKALLNELSS
jgi:predicted ATPase